MSDRFRRLRQAICYLLAAGNYFVPKKRQLLMHSSPDVEDQIVAILRTLSATSDRSMSLVLSVVGEPTAVRPALAHLLGSCSKTIKIVRKNSLAGVWAYWRSDHVFITHGLYLSPWKPAKQTVVNLWHGMPVKAIWKADTRQEFLGIQACSYMLCTSVRYAGVIQPLTGLSRSMLKETGLPRNDLLYSTTPAVRAFRERIAGSSAQLGICLPTFRQTKGQHVYSDGCESENALMMSAKELGAFQEMLAAANITLLVKPHPLSIHYGIEGFLTPNIQLVSNRWLHAQGVTLYEVLGQADFLITDVSSVYIDYLCLNRPVFFYFPDFAAYRETRGFLFEPIEEWLPGRLCATVQQLMAELSEFIAGRDPHRAIRMRLAAELNPQTSPTATSRLMAILGFQMTDNTTGTPR